MRRWIALCSLLGPTAAHATDLKFWNMTTVTITSLQLASAGTQRWGANQCLNDRDKAVDPDERLELTNLDAGKYDVQLTDQHGRTCKVKNVDVKGDGHYAFSLADSDLKDCSK